MAQSHKAKKVSIVGDVPAAPAEPDAPRDTLKKQVADIAQWADELLTV